MHLPDKSIPAAAGGVLTHETVLTAIKREIETNFQAAERSLVVGAAVLDELPAAAVDPASFITRRLAADLARLTEEMLIKTLSRGDHRLMDAITRTLAREFPAENQD